MSSDDKSQIEIRYEAVRAKDGIKWVGQFTTAKHGTEFVRADNGAVIRFDDKEVAEREALRAMMRRLNNRQVVRGGRNMQVRNVVGTGRGRRVSAETVWTHG